MASLTDRLARRTTGGRYIPEADGLRFVAIMLVLLFHATLSIFAAVKGAPNVQPFGGADLQMKGWHVWDYVLNQGRYGVHLFFILSGFILGLPFVSGTPSLRAYYKRRLTRLEPPYLVALTACFLLAPAGMGGHYLAGFFYAHTFVFRTINPVNGALWSLEVEILFYFLLPHLARVFSLSAKPRRLILLGAIVVAEPLQRHFASPIEHFSLVGLFQFFLTGLLLADLYVNGWGEKRKSVLWDVVGATSLGLFLFGGKAGWFYPLLPLIGAGLLGATFLGVTTNRLLSNRYITTIGGMAYSIYLVHVPVMFVLGRAIPKNVFVFSTTLVLASIALGVLFYVLIEQPCMDPEWPQRFRARARRLASRGNIITKRRGRRVEGVLDLTDAAIRSGATPILAGTLPQPPEPPFEPPASRTRS